MIQIRISPLHFSKAFVKLWHLNKLKIVLMLHMQYCLEFCRLNGTPYS